MGNNVDSQGRKGIEHAQPTREYQRRLGVQGLHEDAEYFSGGVGSDGLPVSHNVIPRFTFGYDVGDGGQGLLADEKSIAAEDEKTAILRLYCIRGQMFEETAEGLTRCYNA